MAYLLKEKINCKNILTLSVCLFLVTFVAQVFVSNKLAVEGKGMVALYEKRLTLEKEISEMQLEQSSHASLSYIEEKSKELGFEKNSNYVSIISPVSSTAVIPSF
jgi:cell division protein FtsL